MKYKIVKFNRLYGVLELFVITNSKGKHFSKIAESLEELMFLPWSSSQATTGFTGFETITKEYELDSVGSIQTIKEKFKQDYPELFL